MPGALFDVASVGARPAVLVDDAVYVIILHGFAQDQLASPFRVEAFDAKDTVAHDGETMSVRSMLTDNFAHPHAHGHPP